MAKLALKKGVTSQTLYVFVQDSASTTGAGKTGIVFNAASFTCYYVRGRAAAVAVTLATQTVTGAFSSGGWVEVDSVNMPGVYRFDPPDAAFATGADSVVFLFKGAAGMAPLPLEVELVDYDPRDAVRLGLTNLDATVSSRLAASSYTAPPTTAAIATAIWQDLLAGADFGTAGSIGALLKLDIDAAISSRSTYNGTDTTGVTTLLGRIASALTITGGKVDVNDKTGFSLSGAGLDAVLVESGIVAGPGLTNDAAAQLVSINARQALSLALSALAGVLAGAATTTVTIAPGGLPAGNTRVSATVDANGNRTALTLKVPT